MLPYRTEDGFLAIRCWIRENHAEYESIVVLDDGNLAIEGYLVWQEGPAEVAEVYAERRQGTTRRVNGRVHRSNKAGAFNVSIAIDDLSRDRLTRHDDWDLYIGANTGAVARIAKLADDIAERKRVYVYPEVRSVDEINLELSEEFPPASVTARAYVTSDSDLSVFVIDKD
jgi:hypothetical protein